MPGPGSPGRGRRGGEGTSGRPRADVGHSDFVPGAPSNFQLPKKMALGCHLVPKVLQSDPKGLQNGALDGHFDDLICKKPTLHPTAYLLCFRHILGVLGSPVWQKFLLEMCVGSRSPKKAVTLSLFLIFRRKCVKMGAQMGGEISPKNCPFSHWSTFGCPWVHFP